MLPNMASSKSFRGTMMPSSLSLSAIPENRDFSPASVPLRRHIRQKFSFESDHHPLPPIPTDQFDSDDDNDDEEFNFEEAMQSFPAFRDEKSKYWNDRVSSLLPSLITSSTDPYLIQRKPLAIEKSAPANTPPPPPYNEHEPSISLDSKIEDPESFSPLTDSTAPSENSPSLSLPLLQTKIPGAGFWDDDATSPTSHRLPSLPAELPAAVPVEMPVEFDIEENPKSAQLDTSRHGSTDSGSDTSFAGRRKLRKDSPGSRRRSNSYQSSTVPPPPQLGIKSRATAPIPEPRGRSVSSHPTVAITDMSPISIPVPPIPVARASSAQPANQSPSRGRVRRSWMPGSRSRSNSVDVSQALGSTSSSQAWIMGEENQSDYNTSFLKNAEKVSQCSLSHYLNSSHLTMIHIGT